MYTPTWEPPDPPEEIEPEVCPYCKGRNTSFVNYEDETHTTELHFCWDCEESFLVEAELPF